MALSSDRAGSPESTDPTPDSATALMRRGSSAMLPSRRAMRPVRPAGRPGAGTTGPRRSRLARAKGVLNVVVMTFAMGLVATIAIPSYAFDPVSASQPAFAASEQQEKRVADAQTLTVSSEAAAAPVERDEFAATSMDQVLADRAAAAAAAEAAKHAEELRQQLSQTYNSYSGPSASDLASAPTYPNFSLDSVYQVASQYKGVPYVYGGADPSGFDCSGLIMYVYAQFGISLDHSVRSQSVSGTVISQADARPGDLVILSDLSHDGIYAGNGNILHAPYEGASVREQPLWTSDVFFVRLGI